MSPAFAEAGNALGRKLAEALQINDFQTAERVLRKMEPQMQHQPQWLLLLLHTLDNLHKWAEVVKYSARLLSLAPAQPDNFFICYGRALLKLGRAEECALLCRRRMEQGGQDADLFYTLGTAESYLGHHEEATHYYQEALKKNPGDTRLRRAAGMHRLKLDNPAEVEKDFSFDLLFERRQSYTWPVLVRDKIRGKRVLVRAEQGIGDIIMWSGFLPWLVEQGAHCTLAAPPDMVSLFARSFPEVEILPTGEKSDAQLLNQAFDYQIPLGNLMALCPQEYEPRQHIAYLKPDAARVTAAKQKYTMLGEGRKIGISWHTIHPETGVFRSIPLHKWLTVLQTPNCHFINLQYGESTEDLKLLKRRHRITVHDVIDCDPMQEREDFAAHIAALDAVVSIQNSTVHFAGGLGVPTALMLPVAGDYRWRVEGDRNWWYESVSILRQESCGEWEPVLQQAARWLETLKH